MIYTTSNLKTCLASPQEWYEQWRDEQAAAGFRTVSLSLAGDASLPIYTAVMVKKPNPFRARSYARLSRTDLEAKIAEQAQEREPLHPYIITATGSGSNAVFAIAFRAMAEASAADANMTKDEYVAKNAAQRALGRMLLWVDSFGTASDLRYCAIWGANPDRIAWSGQATNDKGDTRQARFEALGAVGARPAVLSITPDGGYARLFVDTKLTHGYRSKPDMSPNGMQSEMTEQAKAGRHPVHIATAVIDNAIRYAAIFAKSDEITPRTFRVRGPAPIGLNAANLALANEIDKWMEDYVRDHGFRGAAIAVVEGTRLVYAKGYTFAESDYPDIEPTTLFRMASVSKTFCSVAVWKALADAPTVGRSSKMQDVLHLTQPGAGQNAPTDPDFGSITIRHLLESNSGIDQGSVRDSVKNNRKKLNDAEVGAVAQPLTSTLIAKMITAISMPGTPGAKKANGKQDTKYGSTDYFLLGQVAAKLTNKPDFEAALKALVLDPLQMTRTRGSRSRLDQRGADEAMHHLADLDTGKSAVHADLRIVPVQYGYENYEVYDGAGGVSSAIVDLARLAAMLSCRHDNPVLSPAVLDAMLADAVAATTAGSDHGYHGFDGASLTSANAVRCNKGGGNPGVGAGIAGTVGTRFILVARNGSKRDGSNFIQWDDEINARAAMVAWGGHDLFPQFGMPALAP